MIEKMGILVQKMKKEKQQDNAQRVVKEKQWDGGIKSIKNSNMKDIESNKRRIAI